MRPGGRHTFSFRSQPPPVAVPAPGTLTLFLSGLVLLGFALQRRIA
ncbi:MAG: PEP-CTERM sorting domain-containing protein [Gammaproteobacteria bacterium]|nr:PEP-CTERM sorting domain-containing protein [Gammaproteobacteria bacterium]